MVSVGERGPDSDKHREVERQPPPLGARVATNQPTGETLPVWRMILAWCCGGASRAGRTMLALASAFVYQATNGILVQNRRENFGSYRVTREE